MKTNYTYTRWKTLKKGKKDGRSFISSFFFFTSPKEPYPAVDQENMPMYEEELLRLGEKDISMVSEKWEENDQKLFPDYCKKNKELENLKKEHTSFDEDATFAEREYKQSKEKLFAIKEPMLGYKAEITFLGILFLVEIIINSLIGSLFGLQQIETYIFGIGLAFIITILGWFFGSKIKIVPKTSTDKILIIVTPIATFALLIALSYLRAKLFGALQDLEILNVTITESTATIIFLMLNIAFFIAAFLITYAATRPNQKEWKTVDKKYREALKLMKIENAEEKDSIDKIAKKDAEIAQLRSYRIKEFETHVEDAKTVIETVELYILIYRNANMSVRKDAIEPECFKKSPRTIKLPSNLTEEIIWTCE